MTRFGEVDYGGWHVVKHIEGAKKRLCGFCIASDKGHSIDAKAWNYVSTD